MPSLTQDIRFGSPLHKRILSAVQARVKASRSKQGDLEKRWDEGEKRVQAFLPEREVDAAKRLVREGGKPQYTTIQIPYTYAILLSAHTYWTTVFLSRAPIHQFTARHGEPQNSVLVIEALMDYQVKVGEQIAPMFSWLYDAGKWGYGILGVHWDERFERVSEIREVEDESFGIPIGKTRKMRFTKDIRGYHGNKLFNVRPQDFFHDPRVPVSRFQAGEYCGVYTTTNWNHLLRGQRQGIYTNLDTLKKVALGRDTGDGQREIQNDVLDMPDPSDFGTEHVDGKLAARSVELYEMYIELVPEDWKLGRGDQPEKWVFVVTADFKVVVGATPLGAYHNKFPFVLQAIDFDAYNVYPRSMPDVIAPLQQTMDWLLNSHFYNVRAALNNQLVVDPSRLVMKDLLNPLPGGIIRARPQAYGSDVRTSFEQLQINDVTRGHFNDMDAITRLGERTHGVNDAVSGLSNPSSRRSATEVRSTTSFSVNRLKTVAEFMSAQGWSPLSQMMLQNTQQYLDDEIQLQQVGDLALTAGTNWLDVSPESIQGFFDYVPVDGTLPVDRFAQATLWRELFATMVKIPGLAKEFDIARIFAWVAQLTGLKNINQFRVQVVPDEQLAGQARDGNVVKLGPQNPANLPQPKQARGTGQVL